MDGKILGVGTLDEVKGWVTDEEVEIDQRFQDAVIIPGLIEAHMHPQITGVLWLGAYVGRFDRTAPDGTSVKGLETKQAVLDRLKDAAAKLPADGSWVVGWGYQPEFYADSPLTRADLDPISNGHPILDRESCRCISTTPTARRSRSPASATTPISSVSSRRTASRPARSRRSRLLLLSPRSSRRSMPRRCSRRRGAPPSSPIVSA